jgi:TolB-like protein
VSDVFISYARSTAKQATAVADGLRSLGYSVWIDDQLPAHRPYADVIEERLLSAKAVVVVWSADAARSEWVRSEADRARCDHKLVQLQVDDARLPMPFDQIECVELRDWNGGEGPAWSRVAESVAELVGPGWSTAPPDLPDKPSIAVWPFANLSGDQEQEYFAEGMVEEITTTLSRIRSIFVIASGSGRSFKDNGVGLQEAAARMGVRYILEGSVRKAGQRVRIGVKLVDATDGAQIWADRFEDTMDDIFALQDRVALAVAGVIEPAVLVAEMRRAQSRPTDNMGSYDLYLRAVPLVQTFEPVNQARALQFLDRAIELDPKFGRALGAASLAHAQLRNFGPKQERALHQREGLQLAHRAVQAGYNDTEVLCWASDALVILGEDLDDSIALMERARGLNPGSSQVWFVCGIFQTMKGNMDVAVDQVEYALRLDPASWVRANMLAFLGMARFGQGRFAEALALLRESHQLKPTFPLTSPMLAACLGRLGQLEAANRIIHELGLSRAAVLAWGDYLFRNPEHRKAFLEGVEAAREASS